MLQRVEAKGDEIRGVFDANDAKDPAFLL